MSVLNYFEKVLGVSHFLFTEVEFKRNEETSPSDHRKISRAATGIASTTSNTVEYRLIVLDEPAKSPLRDSELFVKMLKAIGLTLLDVKILEFRIHELDSLKLNSEELKLPILSFSPGLSQVLETQAESLGAGSEKIQLFTTFGPRDLVTNDQLKRQTWSDLQRLMRFLQTQSRL